MKQFLRDPGRPPRPEIHFIDHTFAKRFDVRDFLVQQDYLRDDKESSTPVKLRELKVLIGKLLIMAPETNRSASSRFEHAQRVLEIFQNYFAPGGLGPVLQTAILIHDLEFVSNPEEYKKISSELKLLFTSIIGEYQFYAALMIAHGMTLVEEQGEHIRKNFFGTLANDPDFFTQFNEMTDFDRYILIGGLIDLPLEANLRIEAKVLKEKLGESKCDLLKERFLKIAEKNRHLRPKQLAIILRAFNSDHTLTDTEIDTLFTCGYRPTPVKPETLLHIIHQVDLESILIKALEVLDNVRHPHATNRISLWQDCIELLHFYSPVLEAAGFRKLAADCNTAAWEKLNRRTIEIGERAKLDWMHQRATEFYNSHMEEIRLILNKYADRTIPVGDGFIQPTSSRLKSPSSCDEKRYKNYNSENLEIPDILGFEVIIPQDTQPEDLAVAIQEIIIEMEKLGLKLGHTKENDQPISIMIKRFNKNPGVVELFKAQPYGENIEFDNRETYEAIHLDFVLTLKVDENFVALMQTHFPQVPPEDYEKILGNMRIGLDIHIVARGDHHLNNTEGAHWIYKAKENLNPGEEINMPLCLVAIRDINDRARQFYDDSRKERKTRLSPRSVVRMDVFGITVPDIDLNPFRSGV